MSVREPDGRSTGARPTGHEAPGNAGAATAVRLANGARRCAIGIAALLATGAATAADHRDSPSLRPLEVAQSDINDVYAFMNPNAPRELVLVMTVVRNAQPDATFSTALAYDFLIESFANPNDDATSAGQQRLRCVFPTTAQISCALGGADGVVVTGQVTPGTTDDVSAVASNGGLRVWAGLRDDPFFFNAPGLNASFGNRTAATPAGAPAQRAPTPRFEEGVTANQLADPNGTANSFFREDTLAIVIGVDRSLLDANGTAPILKLWGLTANR